MTGDNAGKALTFGIVARVFAPFALGYFLSYFYRTVNAVIAPDLVAETGLSASSLGLMSSAYFLAFAAFQIPLGILLDRYGPRRVEAILLLFAAAGAIIFAKAESAGGLLTGRALIGFGVSSCLIAAIRAYIMWFPPGRLPMVNGFQMALGGLGALAATEPVGMALDVLGWRGVFLVLAFATIVVAAIVYWAVPTCREDGAKSTLSEAFGGVGQVFTSPAFWRVAPLSAISQAAFLAIQGLWAGPWLRDVAGLDRDEVTRHLLLIAAAMVVGSALIGLAVERAQRFGLSASRISILAMVVFLVLQVILAFDVVPFRGAMWILFGFFGTSGILSYALLPRKFPKILAGRVVTGLSVQIFFLTFVGQWAIGVIIELWPEMPGGGYNPVGYQAAFLSFAALQAVALLWYLGFRRDIQY